MGKYYWKIWCSESDAVKSSEEIGCKILRDKVELTIIGFSWSYPRVTIKERTYIYGCRLREAWIYARFMEGKWCTKMQSNPWVTEELGHGHPQAIVGQNTNIREFTVNRGQICWENL